MRKSGLALFLCILQVVMLCGCGQGESGERDVSLESRSTAAESGDLTPEGQTGSGPDTFSWEQLPVEEVWRDNTLDDYTAAVHLPLRPQQPEGELGGGWAYALGSSCGAVFKKHILGPGEKNWDELKIVTNQGEENSVQLAFEENAANQAWGMGGIIGSDHFIMLDCITPESPEAAGWQYRFFEIDENQKVLQSVQLDFLSDDGYEAPHAFMVDKSGNIHFTTGYLGYSASAPDKVKNYYMITDPEGTLLAKLDYTGITMRLVALYDGRVALWTQLVDAEGRSTGSRMEWVDIETGEAVLLAEFGKDVPKDFQRQSYYTFWDEETLLYADSRGLHFADLSGNAAGDVYIWSNHGIRFSAMEALQIFQDGQINLIYYDFDDKANFLSLKPTQEKVEIQEIVFAASPYMREIYNPTVVEFNKKYPAYHIELKTDYEEAALLTELTAGKGPVLIDTQLTGFEGHKKLWMSLEGLFAGEEWEEALLPRVMELGEIDETLYGVVSSFELETVVIPGDTPTDWDYDSFLDCMEEHSSIEAAYNGQNTIWTFMTEFLVHGLEDNYLLDAASGKTYFDSDKFRRALRLAKTYCNEEEWIEPGTPMLEGKVFCNTVCITRPELIDLYRILYGEDANYIGYPAGDGSAHYIDGSCLLAVRATATDEEKKVAGTFLRMLLSREGQLEGTKDPNFWLSVRRDVLEEQISQVNERSMPTIYGFPQIMLGDDYDREYDARLLYELLENARPREHFPRELNEILIEELEEYAAGIITEDVLIERLTKRVELYLAEQS